MSTQVSRLSGLSEHVDCTQDQVDSLEPLDLPQGEPRLPGQPEGLVLNLLDRTAHLTSLLTPHTG